MSDRNSTPLILIIDDLFGRTHPDRRNEERANLCGQFLFEDVTKDEVGKGTPQKIKTPIAQAVFHRGQTPICSNIGDTVENDLEGTLRVVRDGWVGWRPGKPHWAMVLLDLCFYTGRVTEESDRKGLGMPEGCEGDDDPQRYFGLRVLQAIHDEFPELPVIILSSKSRGEVSHKFSVRGALAFLPREDEQSPDLLRKYLWQHGLIPDAQSEIVGYSKTLLIALREARIAATNRRNILLRGERGTGKGTLAWYIHRQTESQKQSPFLKVNSSVLSPDLYASELFGIRKGIATGVMERVGLIKKAEGGDLFFDEIKDMHPQVQAGILNLLDERQFAPVGDENNPQEVDVRFLSATNIDIEALAATGSFRPDLLDRLRQGGTVFLPPLQDRKEDIPLLVEKFVRDAERETPDALERQIDPETLTKLHCYSWPGNIRELHDCIFNAVKHHPHVEHLVPFHIRLPLGPKPTDKSEANAQVAVPNVSREVHPQISDLDELMRTLSTFEIDAAQRAQLAGKWPEIQRAYARMSANYLKAALVATSKPTPEKPEGEIFIHPAVKLMTGNPKLSASKAADIIKKLIGTSPSDISSLLSDSILKEAYEKALSLRPRQQKSGKKAKRAN